MAKWGIKAPKRQVNIEEKSCAKKAPKNTEYAECLLAIIIARMKV